MTKTETKNVGLTLDTVAADGTFEGFGSVFGVKDSFDDVVMPGPFSLTLKAAAKLGGRLPLLL